MTIDMNSSHTEKEIDGALKVPAFFFISSAVVWLLLALITGTISLMKNVQPDILNHCEYLSYGRVFSAFQNIFVFGWIGNLTFLIIPWMMSRLSGMKLPSWFLILVCGKFWNLGVSIAVVMSFMGSITGLGLWDTAPIAAWILMGSYAIAMTWSVVVLILRRKQEIFISQWLLATAVFALPWLISIAYFLTSGDQARGVLPNIVAAWYEFNLVWLWLVPLALGIIFYSIPKISGVLLKDYYFAEIAIGSFIFIATWGGTQHLFGGPYPAWIPTVGQTAALSLLFPGILISSMFLKTFFSGASQIMSSVPLRFISFSGFAVIVLLLLTFLSGFTSVQELFSLTYFRQALTWHAILLIAGMALPGAVYIIIPKIYQFNWPLPFLVGFHFLTSALGGVLIIGGWLLVAYVQGVGLNSLDVSGVVITPASEVFYSASKLLFIPIIGLFIMGIGMIGFAFNILVVLGRVALLAICAGVLGCLSTTNQSCSIEGAKG